MTRGSILLRIGEHLLNYPIIYNVYAIKQTSIGNGLGFWVSITITSLPRLLILVVSAYLTTLLGTHAIAQGQWMMLEPTLPIRTKIAQRSW
jgi:hypothetical protein